MSEVRVTTLKDTSGNNSSTTAQIAVGRAKAWVNFNGSGAVAIRANFNVNSITDNGLGDYTVNFSTALTDTNYSYCGAGMVNLGVRTINFHPSESHFNAGSLRLAAVLNNDSGLFDAGVLSLTIFR